MRLETGLIEARQEDGIGWLVFNNPAKLNAISPEMTAEALGVIEAYASEPSVHVVIMRGAGDKAFISGGDISRFDTTRSNAEADEQRRALSEHFKDRIVGCGKPVLAMIHGYCLGGGMDIALSADLRFAASDARLGIPAASRGIAYPASSLQRLVDVTGPSFAKDILFSARKVDADEALHAGLVDRVFAPELLEQETVAYARVIAANAPLAVRAAKFFIHQIGLECAERDEERMQAMIDAAAASEDFREATRAFAEKRKPVFLGI
jgi:enoyl-CoA hydratase/carnithine racemase